MLRNSFKYVNYSDLKKFSSDFKAVYNAPNEKAGLEELGNIREKWGGEEVSLCGQQLERCERLFPIP